MSITKEIVEYAAHLARMELKSNELEKFSRQLQDILDFIDKLKEIDTEKIAPTSHILPINNVFREDEPRESLPGKDVLEGAPKKEENFFVVPKVIE